VISPTSAGLQRMAAVQAARTRLYGDMLADWSPEDRATLATLLSRLNQALVNRNRR
jgi:DNA-binding MarR family transcriptional regulator